MAKKDSVKYRAPGDWLAYDAHALIDRISCAQAAVHSLISAPFNRAWLDARAPVQNEITATCSITGPRPDAGAADPDDSRVASCTEAHDWICGLAAPPGLSLKFICEVHDRLIRDTGSPTGLREKGQQIYFGTPQQKGVKGGKETRECLQALVNAWDRADQEPLIVKAIALHYHIAAIHPFRDGNGRTARALETVFRQTAGLTGLHFVPMSEYYDAERTTYFEALTASRLAGHDLTPFLEFALKGLTRQCQALFTKIRASLAVALYENTMLTLFGRLNTGKRQAMAERQVELLRILLEHPGTPLLELYQQLRAEYERLKNPWKAFLRDMHDLTQIRAIAVRGANDQAVWPRLDWPATITERLFFQHYTDVPRSGMILSTAV